MREYEYSQAAVEVLDILNHTDIEDVQKIPKSFIEFLTNIASKNYELHLNHDYSMNALNVKNETKKLLGFIYITWWCDNEEEREKYKKQIQEENIKEQIAKTNYSVDINDIFKNRQENQKEVIKNQEVLQTGIVQYKKESVIKRIVNKILSIWNHK